MWIFAQTAATDETLQEVRDSVYNLTDVVGLSFQMADVTAAGVMLLLGLKLFEISREAMKSWRGL